MGILLCEQNFRDVWRRNKSVGQKFEKICAHTHKHTHAAKLVVRMLPKKQQFLACDTADAKISALSGKNHNRSVAYNSDFGITNENWKLVRLYQLLMNMIQHYYKRNTF